MATIPTIFSGGAGGDAQMPYTPDGRPAPGGGSFESPFGLGGAIPAIDSLRDLATSGRTDLNSSLYGGGRGGTPLFRDGGPVGYAFGGEAQMPYGISDRPVPGGGSFGGRGGTIPAIYSLGDLATRGRTDLNSSLYGGGRGGGGGGLPPGAIPFMSDGGSMGFRPLGYADGGVADNGPGLLGRVWEQIYGAQGVTPVDKPIGTNPFFAADPARYTPSVAPYTEPPGQSNGSSALDSFRRDFGREPQDTAELREYMMSGGGGTPMGMRDGGPVGYANGGDAQMPYGIPMAVRCRAAGLSVAAVEPFRRYTL
jgi:hypothetical protein